MRVGVGGWQQRARQGELTDRRTHLRPQRLQIATRGPLQEVFLLLGALAEEVEVAHTGDLCAVTLARHGGKHADVLADVAAAHVVVFRGHGVD